MDRPATMPILPTVCCYLGRVVLFVGVLPLVRRTGGPLEVAFAVGGAVLVAVPITRSVRASNADVRKVAEQGP